MSLSTLFFLLRLLLAILLYTFVGGVVYLLWQDLRRANAAARGREQRRGRLVIVASRLPPTGSIGGLPSPAAGDSFPLLPLTSLGRAPTNTIALADDTASLEHALISWRSGKWWLEDLGSRNGTRLNGDPVMEPTVISAGDLIALGQAEFKLVFD